MHDFEKLPVSTFAELEAMALCVPTVVNMKQLIGIASATLAVSGAAISGDQNSKGSYMKAQTFEQVEYAYPAFLDNPTITTSKLGDGRTEVRILFSSSFTPGNNHISLELYFDAIAGGSKFDHAVVAALGEYTYKSSPTVSTGNAGVIKIPDQNGTRRELGTSTQSSGKIQIGDFRKVGEAEVRVEGNSVYVRYLPSLVNNSPATAILLRYLPSSIPFSNLANDLNSVTPVRYYVDPALKGGFYKALRVPSGITKRL